MKHHAGHYKVSQIAVFTGSYPPHGRCDRHLPFESLMYVRWYADNLWLFAPVGAKLKEFLVTLPQYPF